MAECKYCTRTILRNENETDKIVSFLEEHHKPEAILIKGFLENNKDRLTAEVKEQIRRNKREFVYNNYSIIATDPDTHPEKIVAVSILVPWKNLPPSARNPEKHSSGTLLQELEDCLDGLYEKTELYKKFPRCSKSVSIRHLAVDKSYRGQGLAKLMLRKSLEWAKENGLDLVDGIFTLPAAKKAAESTGFQKIVDYDLHEVKDKDGKRVFADVSPNNITTVMAYKIH